MGVVYSEAFHHHIKVICMEQVERVGVSALGER